MDDVSHENCEVVGVMLSGCRRSPSDCDELIVGVLVVNCSVFSVAVFEGVEGEVGGVSSSGEMSKFEGIWAGIAQREEVVVV